MQDRYEFKHHCARCKWSGPSLRSHVANAAEFRYTIGTMKTESARPATSRLIVWIVGAGQTQASSILVAIALIFLVAGCATREVPFQTEGTQGQVGHPIHAGIILDEKAAGCGGHAAGAALVTASSLPPGVRQSGQNDWLFVGTPTKSGHWRTQVTLIDLVCDGSRPDQTLPLEFDISP
jgi:hypothetical protein